LDSDSQGTSAKKIKTRSLQEQSPVTKGKQQ